MKKGRQDSLLWRIEGETISGVSYLFGTMHVRDRRAFRLLDPVRERIDACEAFAAEFGLEEVEFHFDPRLLTLLPGQTLDCIIPRKRYEKLRQVLFVAYGIDLDLFRDKRPIILANLIDEQILSRNMPFSLDHELWIYARSCGKKVYGIETYAEQIDIIRQVPLRQQVDALLAIGRNISRHRRQLLKMTELFEKGEIRRLYKSARRGSRSLRKLMLYDRNEIMAVRIAKLFREQSVVCAIGAGHLPGAKGVLRLLKHQGLRVRPEPVPVF